jgi:hypothetical protein
VDKKGMLAGVPLSLPNTAVWSLVGKMRPRDEKEGAPQKKAKKK